MPTTCPFRSRSAPPCASGGITASDGDHPGARRAGAVFGPAAQGRHHAGGDPGSGAVGAAEREDPLPDLERVIGPELRGVRSAVDPDERQPGRRVLTDEGAGAAGSVRGDDGERVAPWSAAALVITWPLRTQTPEMRMMPLGVVARMPTTLRFAIAASRAAESGPPVRPVARVTVTGLDDPPSSPAIRQHDHHHECPDDARAQREHHVPGVHGRRRRTRAAGVGLPANSSLGCTQGRSRGCGGGPFASSSPASSGAMRRSVPTRSPRSTAAPRRLMHAPAHLPGVGWERVPLPSLQ